MAAVSLNPELRDLATSEFGNPVTDETGKIELQVLRGPCALSEQQRLQTFQEEIWYEKFSVLEKGLVIELGEQRYCVQWDAAGREEAPWDYPHREKPLIFTPTQAPLTPSLPPGQHGEFYLWGTGYYQQGPIYVSYKGVPATQFLCVPKWQGQDFSANLALALEDSKPVRAWFEGSCT
jgi:hypothetical protein